jgi:hypothetical protein
MVLKKIEWEGAYWIHLDQDRDDWRAVMNTVVNVQIA